MLLRLTWHLHAGTAPLQRYRGLIRSVPLGFADFLTCAGFRRVAWSGSRTPDFSGFSLADPLADRGTGDDAPGQGRSAERRGRVAQPVTFCDVARAFPACYSSAWARARLLWADGFYRPSVFILHAGTVYQTYSTTGRGVEFLMGYYGVLDRVPEGREEGEAWQTWIHRHDEYDRD